MTRNDPENTELTRFSVHKSPAYFKVIETLSEPLKVNVSYDKLHRLLRLKVFSVLFYFSLFGATKFRGQLCLRRDYISNNYGIEIELTNNICLPLIFEPTIYNHWIWHEIVIITYVVTIQNIM